MENVMHKMSLLSTVSCV